VKWELTLHGGKHHGERLVFEAETADEARRFSFRELERKAARVFELEMLE